MKTLEKILFASLLLIITSNRIECQEFEGPEFEFDYHNYYLQLFTDLSPNTILPLESNVQLKIDALAKNVRPGYDLYLSILPMYKSHIIIQQYDSTVLTSLSIMRNLQLHVGAMSLKGGASLSQNGRIVYKTTYISCEDMKVLLAGKSGRGDLSQFKISDDNYPIHLAFSVEDIVNLFMNTLLQNYDKSKVDQMKEEAKNYKIPVSWAFIGSFGNGGDQKLSGKDFKLSIPNLPVYYDGIMLVPFMVKRRPDNSLLAIFIEKQSKPIYFQVKGDETKLETIPNLETDNKSQQSNPLNVNGKLKILSINNNSIRIGEYTTLSMEIEYENLMPGSEIYVILNPVNNDKIISSSKGYTQEVKNGQMKFEFCNKSIEASSGILKIPEINHPVRADVPFIGEIEAAQVAILKAGGSGRVRGSVSFVPPAYSTYYNKIRVTPIALQWDIENAKLCAVYDSEVMEFKEIMISGR